VIIKGFMTWLSRPLIIRLGRDVVKTLIISDNQGFRDLIIKTFDNQTVSLSWLSWISDTSENKPERLDSDNQINISRLISFLDEYGLGPGVHTTLMSDTLSSIGLEESSTDRVKVYLLENPMDLSACANEEHEHGVGAVANTTLLSDIYSQ
jgi:hypothetical protein